MEISIALLFQTLAHVSDKERPTCESIQCGTEQLSVSFDARFSKRSQMRDQF